MIDAKRGDERIMRVTEIDGERASWVCEGELVRCESCVNWDAMDAPLSARLLPRGAQVHAPAADWCCWGAGKGESDER